MENMQAKLQEKKDLISEAEKELKKAKSDLKNLKTLVAKKKYESKQNQLEKAKDALKKLELQVTDKEENKDIALGTSKLNYLDPRISVAWCKKHNVDISKVNSKTQREKFRWAIDMATPDYHFYNYECDIELRDLSHLEGMETTQCEAKDETQEDEEEDED
jgi:DNA topoisomerase-1